MIPNSLDKTVVVSLFLRKYSYGIRNFARQIKMANTLWCNIEYCYIKGGYTGLANKTYGPVPFAEAKSGGKGNLFVQ